MESMINGARYRIVNINGEVLNGIFASNKFVDSIYKLLESRIKKVERADGRVLVGEERDLKDNLIVGTRYTVETNTNETIDGIYDSKHIVDVVDGTHIHFLMFTDATVKLKKTGVQLASVVRQESAVQHVPLPVGPRQPSPVTINADYGGRRTRRKRLR